ncbi:nucleotidyl transferase AbiEii/AbiGii toxin family protein [Planococcus alpniumensis]|uniref:nucleotidyl transferase AbiEii/AbiGii toxin family protein n=1 Tax=Planococcus alpniumensis TaxID=2708345 RepID=UPI001B8D8548|nr:nucleotidyl transferase AbiEii/AbiGii toxin family protein [Planococcus sp. MSAK28401]
MRLHEENELFNELVRSAAAAYGLQNFQIEKDYYVSLLLKQLVSNFPGIVFKGGTSLSKCYDVIKRFSEDLDLSVPLGESNKLPRSEKKKLKTAIESVIEDLGFALLNPEKIRSGREFNEYEIGYRKEFEGDSEMSPHILVETNVAYRPFPFEQLEVSNYITKFVIAAEGDEAEKEQFMDEYEMRPFEANVQTIDRTFLDKIFAICDYYEKKESTRYSRHLYDLHMIERSGFVDPEGLKMLIPEVIEIRRDGRDTASCQLGYELKKTLKEIIQTDFYKQDYNRNTKTFLAEDVSYEETIDSLKKISDSSFLPNVIKI